MIRATGALVDVGDASDLAAIATAFRSEVVKELWAQRPLAACAVDN
jgi:hypothetical protein